MKYDLQLDERAVYVNIDTVQNKIRNLPNLRLGRDTAILLRYTCMAVYPTSPLPHNPHTEADRHLGLSLPQT